MKIFKSTVFSGVPPEYLLQSAGQRILFKGATVWKKI